MDSNTGQGSEKPLSGNRCDALLPVNSLAYHVIALLEYARKFDTQCDFLAGQLPVE